MKYTYVIGDVHGQLDPLKALVTKFERDHGAEGFHIYLTGDVMDRGRLTYRTYQYVKNDPRFTLLIGNHESFYLKGKEGIEEIFDNEQGLTVLNMFDYYSESKNDVPEQSGDEVDERVIEAVVRLTECMESFLPLYNRHDIDHENWEKIRELTDTGHDSISAILSVKYPKLFEKIGYEPQPFLYNILKDMKDYFKQLDYIKTIEVNGQKYALSHSGHIPVTKNGKRIKHNDELDEHDIHNMLWKRRDQTKRICDHVILHGHTPETDCDKCVIWEDNEPASINLDARASQIGKRAAWGLSVKPVWGVRAFCPDTGMILKANHYGTIQETQIESLRPETMRGNIFHGLFKSSREMADLLGEK